jgi:FixJ family two-component response regulator
MKIKHIRPMLPVILITGYGDVPTAVKAMQNGADEFIEKPINRETLIAKVHKVLSYYEGQYPGKVKDLTKTECLVLKLIVEGMSNKEIAHKLYRSTRTIEDHRNHIMHKLGVHNLVDLVKVAMKMQVSDLEK